VDGDLAGAGWLSRGSEIRIQQAARQCYIPNMSKKASKSSRKVAKSAGKALSGSFMGIRIVDPVGKPRGTTVKRIREAVAAARKRA
jgi:hypothetical protein